MKLVATCLVPPVVGLASLCSAQVTTSQYDNARTGATLKREDSHTAECQCPTVRKARRLQIRRTEINNSIGARPGCRQIRSPGRLRPSPRKPTRRAHARQQQRLSDLGILL